MLAHPQEVSIDRTFALSKKMVLALTVAFAIGLLAFASVVRADPSGHGGRPLSTDLTGAEEVPGPGDPDGSGTVFMQLNPGQGEICYTLTVEDIEAATAAHIHVGEAGVAGPVVVPLVAPTTGSSSACAEVERDLVKAIIQNPSAYYVNVHNAVYPAGAVRGQLSK